jgi:plasmid stabilization system protein ParE
VAAVRWSPAAFEDVVRLAAFLHEDDPRAAGDTARLIFDALRVLEKYPLIGRSIRDDRRELIIYRGRTGYLAQYEYDALDDEVVILAISHQREIEH